MYLSIVYWEGQVTISNVHYTADHQASGHSTALRTGQHVQKITHTDHEAVTVLRAVESHKNDCLQEKVINLGDNLRINLYYS